MKKEELRNDLSLLNKLKDEFFRYSIFRANNIFISLNISNEIDFHIYQLYFEDLKKVTYQEIISFNRLLNTEYCDSIILLQKQIMNDSKIINFPKIIN